MCVVNSINDSNNVFCWSGSVAFHLWINNIFYHGSQRRNGGYEMISFDSKDGHYEFKGSGDDIAKDYIGLTVALGRTLLEGGMTLPAAKSAISTLCAQGMTLIEMPQPEKTDGNNLIDFVTGGDNTDV